MRSPKTISGFPTNPVVGMIVQYKADDNVARDIVTLDRLPVQQQGETPAWGQSRETPVRAGGTDGDPDFRAAAQREMERWAPPLAVPPAPADLGRAATLDPAPPPPPPPRGDFNIWGNFKYCMTTGYSLFRGRASRGSFLGFIAVYILGFFGLMLGGIALDLGSESQQALTVVLPGLFFLACVIPGAAVMVRRFHDIGITGWAAIALVIPFLNMLTMIALALVPGSPNDNRYGPAPD